MEHVVQTKNHRPPNATRESIGKLVTIQVFAKDYDEEAYRQPDAEKTVIDPNSQATYIGVLEALVLTSEQIIFKLHGCDGIAVIYEDELIEIYTHD